MSANAERARLDEAREGRAPWKKWGPYLSERQWGTVREDYSANGDAWNYLTHDQARSRAYRWGEDGIAGISDEHQHLCFALALWNGRDPILKERLFGLANNEGNHGEDVKECYFYLDNLPSHAYMKYLYKYPQQAFPYAQLIEENRRRSRLEPEYELLDTGIFDTDRYFDVFVEYAKDGPEQMLVSITAINRGPDACATEVDANAHASTRAFMIGNARNESGIHSPRSEPLKVGIVACGEAPGRGSRVHAYIAAPGVSGPSAFARAGERDRVNVVRSRLASRSLPPTAKHQEKISIGQGRAAPRGLRWRRWSDALPTAARTRCRCRDAHRTSRQPLLPWAREAP